MANTLKISEAVINKLSTINFTYSGCLHGIFYKNSLLVLGLHVETDEKDEIINSLPTEVDICGVIDINSEENNVKVDDILRKVDITDNPIYISFNSSLENSISAYFIVNDQLKSANFEIVKQANIYSEFVHVRLRASLPIYTELNIDAIKEAFLTLRKQFTSGQVAFNFQKSKVYLVGHDLENRLIGLSGDPTVGELCDESYVTNEGQINQRKRKSGQNIQQQVIEVYMFKKSTRDFPVEGTTLHAPVVHVDKKTFQSLQLWVEVDALSMVHVDSKVVNLYDIIVESSCRNLRLQQNAFFKFFTDCIEEQGKISNLKIYHFYPESCGHFVTKAYPKNFADIDLEEERSLLHKQLLLPVNRPIFRKSNVFLFRSDIQIGGPLINPHEGLIHTGNENEVVIVRGKYLYYHYCQNKMDDNGWGCAYRSLQTLASWFLLQGYTCRPVPTFDEIQKCLVDIGDKSNSFIGSKQWIGSTEVTFVLNSLLGITSKIIYVSSGEELATKGPDLINHFKTQGTPIMIGGGVLAHTILGVDYNRKTGDIQFLVLDPHYTGPEDVEIIQKKGWCGWKGMNFWDKGSYYNMCLPQAPTCI
ncbi:ufm1-specific protease 2 [Agrilus planipennis]|uniref:Probable Ufm1-specific protease 2 n=1 Tax=Agrilus planipennis TaxID=224129 RepID=A0A1W4XW74_AGRPL|nr:ufm1-specific protease 2 [Agrilus planipennis]XP_018336685.1 ufm1-specific protease 2 [Agrilus planipennis]